MDADKVLKSLKQMHEVQDELEYYVMTNTVMSTKGLMDMAKKLREVESKIMALYKRELLR
jgi:hypothetical protein